MNSRKQTKAKAHARYVERKRLARIHAKRPAPIYRQWARAGLSDAIAAPHVFYLDDTRWHSELTSCLTRLRAAFQHPGICLIDLRRTRLVIAGAMLLFFAELSRLKHQYPSKRLKFRRSDNATVNQVFEHLGVFGMFGYKSGVIPQRDDVVGWKVVSSDVNDGGVAGGLLEAQESLSREDLKHIFRGVSEAIPNAVEHAYLSDRHDGLVAYDQKRWWMFCRESESRLYVGVCDLGIGIPRSLPRTIGEAMVAVLLKAVSWGKASDDAGMIRAAMELSRTRTQLDERGKGFGDMRQVVDQIPGSELFIFSNKGRVSYRDGEFKMQLHRQSILGTLVVWSIPVGERDER